MKDLIGVLSYQGGADLHIKALESLDIKCKKIYYWDNFENLSGLILPGGESSVQYRYCIEYNLFEKIRDFANTSKPILGTCAGSILLSNFVSEKVRGMGLLDIDIERNVYGRQIDSGMHISDKGNEVIFIRAPGMCKVGLSVEVLDTYKSKPIFVRENNIYAATFHPEVHDINKNNILARVFKKN